MNSKWVSIDVDGLKLAKIRHINPQHCFSKDGEIMKQNKQCSREQSKRSLTQLKLVVFIDDKLPKNFSKAHSIKNVSNGKQRKRILGGMNNL